MIHDQLESVDAAVIDSLVQNRVAESTTVEFKAALPDRSDKGIFEFLKDACAMANSAGGDIVYGVRELDGVADAVQPISEESEDKTLLRLGQMLDSGIEPRIPGMRFQSVAVSGGFVLVMRVPQSFSGPHRIVRNGQHRFPLRNQRHVSDMSYDQLRTAFDRTSSLAAEARSFRRARIHGIVEAQQFRALEGGAAVVLHILPLAGFGGAQTADVRAAKDSPHDLVFGRWSNTDWAFNFDGFVVSSTPSSGKRRAYTQLFRSGAVELYSAGHSFESQHGAAVIGGMYVTDDLRRMLGVGLSAVRKIGAAGGAFVAASLLNVQGRKFSLGTITDISHGHHSDRDQLLFAEQWVENIEGVNLHTVLRPMLDVLWQSFGLESCLCYDEDGTFNENTKFR